MSDAWSRFYEAVHTPQSEAFKNVPHGSIQWKGTDVCIDIRCECGHQSHFDGEFLYNFRCPKCKKVWAVDCHVKLLAIPDEHLPAVGSINTVELDES